MRNAEREQWMQLVADEREAHRRERQELLNRIAQPERIVTDSAEKPHEPQPMSATDLELAFIGGEVPAGVDVGSLRDYANGQ